VPAQSRHGDEFCRWRGGVREQLAFDPARIVVQGGGDATGEQLVAALRARGLAAKGAESTGIATWYTIDLEREIGNVAVLRAVLERTLRADGVAFVAPVLRGIDGAFATITPDLLLRARPEKRGVVAAVLAEVVPAAQVIEVGFGGMHGALRAHSASRNGLDVLAEANRLAVDPRIEWAEPDWQFAGRAALVPNDPGWPQLWGMMNTGQFGGVPDMDMDCDLAWDITTGSPAVKILVIDTGVQMNHPDLAGVIGADFTGQAGGGAPVNVCDVHGTAVAGCVGATLGNGLGTVGVAPDCRLLSARTFVSTNPCSGGWTSYASWTVAALVWAQFQGARVTNNSNEYGFTSAAIDAAYAAAWTAGVVHFASAGNGAASTVSYPASIPCVNSVSALTPTGALAAFSNSGARFAAPGDQIYTTDRTGPDGYYPGDYGMVSGTSFASPYAAGVAALVLSQTPSLTARQVELAMRAARDLGAPGRDPLYGWGFVNANSALRSIPYGTGVEGSGGITPDLYATGVLRLGETVQVEVDRTVGQALGVLGIGTAPGSFPLFGGTALVALPWDTLGVVCGGAPGSIGEGSASIPVLIPNTPSLANTSVYLQAMLIDPGVPPGYLSFTNGLQLRVGP
jgi:subtilisin family serine protease